MTGTKAAHGRTRLSPALLGVYLNDHFAGATAGLELVRRISTAQRGRSGGEELARLTREIAEDRSALREIMTALAIPVRRYKVAFAWMGEKAGRLKPNRRVRTRSPLSDLLELEMLRLGVEGKAAAWTTLRTLADHNNDRLDTGRLDDLISRAKRQADTLEDLRIRTASKAFIAQ